MQKKGFLFLILLLIQPFAYYLREQCFANAKLYDGKGLLIIPGLGSPDRLTTVLHNLKMLQLQLSGSNPKMDCIVYVYAPRNSTDFWSRTNQIAEVMKLCTLVDNPYGKVTANLYLAQPFFIKNSYSYVFTLLDDCLLIGEKFFPIERILHIMDVNKLTVASPRVIGANKGGGQQFRTIMQRDAQPNTVGYESVFVEIFAWITTPLAYEALWELLYPAVNPYGWGYDMWYDNYALHRIPSHKMGIISVIDVKHDQDFTAENGGRTETASMKEKWLAVLKQEVFYKRHMGIDLKRCRKNSRMANSSWNGPVLGYLYD